MEIDITEHYTFRSDEFRYQIAISKVDGKKAKYYLDFKKITQDMRAWFSPVYTEQCILENAYVIEFYDVKALIFAARQGRSAFDTYSHMGYTFSERERLFVDGINYYQLRHTVSGQARF